MTPSQFFMAAAIRWGALVALALVIGGLALDLLVLPGGAPELAAVRRRLRSWNAIGVVVLMLATAGELVVRARTMSGGPLAAALAAVPLVLTRPHFGTVWIARMLALLLLILLRFVPRSWARGAALVLAAGVALTTSLTGHAGDWGDLSVSVFADWAHVLGAAAWTGGSAPSPSSRSATARRGPRRRSPVWRGASRGSPACACWQSSGAASTTPGCRSARGPPCGGPPTAAC